MNLSLLKTKSSLTLITGLLLTIFLFIIGVFGPHYLNLATNNKLSVPLLFLISRIFFWLLLFIVYLYVTKIEQQPLMLWDEKSYKLTFYIVSVFLLLLVVVLGSFLIIQLVNYFGWNKQSIKEQATMNFNTPLKLFTVITAAVTEELIFRGYLMSRLQLFFKGAFWPIIISALVFGLCHLGYGTVANAVVPLFIGLVFAYHYQKYRNIKILIICHFLIDFYALIIPH